MGFHRRRAVSLYRGRAMTKRLLSDRCPSTEMERILRDEQQGMSLAIPSTPRTFVTGGAPKILTIHLFVRLLVDRIVVDRRYVGVILLGVSSPASSTAALRCSIPATSSPSSGRAVEEIAKGLSWHTVLLIV